MHERVRRLSLPIQLALFVGILIAVGIVLDLLGLSNWSIRATGIIGGLLCFTWFRSMGRLPDPWDRYRG